MVATAAKMQKKGYVTNLYFLQLHKGCNQPNQKTISDPKTSFYFFSFLNHSIRLKYAVSSNFDYTPPQIQYWQGRRQIAHATKYF
jgi:hypothetical protein